MVIEFELPDIQVPTQAISEYWLRYAFVGSPSQSSQVNALANTYMRLCEAAIVEYRLGSIALREVWADPASLGLRTLHRSVSHFESCITDVHRAIAAYRRLRNHRARDPLSLHLADVKPAFISDQISYQVRAIRDAVHHLEEKVVNGDVAEGQPIALKPDGHELPHPSATGQTIKTYDRLAIGPHILKFSELAELLAEMSYVASKVAEFDPSPPCTQL